MNAQCNRPARGSLAWVCILALSVLPHAPALAATAVNFAGFAYIGDNNSLPAAYPYTVTIEAERDGDISILDSALRQHVAATENDSFVLEFDRLSSLKGGQGSPVVLAFALDRETVSVEQIGQDHKLLVELSAQALFVDFREMAVIASYPLVAQYIDVKPVPPTQEDIAAAIRKLYLGSGPDSVLAAFASKLQGVELNTAVQRRVRVTKAVIADAALVSLQRQQGVQPEMLEAALAQDFSKFLSANQQIPVLPPAKGQAIGNRMATRFADGSVYMLAIPEADYTIELSLDELRKVEFARSNVGQSLIYGAFLAVRVQEPLSGKIYFDAKLRNGATKVVPATQESIDDSAAFQDALLALMDKFTSALGQPSPAWAEKHTGDKSNVKQMTILGEVLQSCR